MKVLIISQVFWPDTSSGSQHVTDLAEELSLKNHKVDVLCSNRAYENPKTFYPNSEIHKGISIQRLRHTNFGKSSRVGRFLDFVSFNAHVFCKLFTLRKGSYDLLIGLTVPPLLSFLCIIASKIKKLKFVFWTMDLQPELAIVAGYLKRESQITKLILRIGDYLFRNADLIITLDKYMASHIEKRGGKKKRIKIIPVWPVMYEVYEGDRLSNPFRTKYGFGNRMVIMYSGNHSVMHPLETLLNSALHLRNDSRFIFVFIGGGVRKKEVTDFKVKYDLGNILQLPYQPRNKIHLSLASADIHVVIQGKRCAGYTHPNKIYGAMYIGRPILYIGPKSTHVSDILDNCPGNIMVEHGQSDLLVSILASLEGNGGNRLKMVGESNREFAKYNFSKSRLLNRMLSEISVLVSSRS